uniref:Variant surface glycoprotein 1219 n=1 Tax=Trypanosoma brucei TaxID=5691 RepID=M4SZM1_9TRYP|nr:variant surface glycoprotein 1219 [Trypanosoma brucei]
MTTQTQRQYTLDRRTFAAIFIVLATAATILGSADGTISAAVTDFCTAELYFRTIGDTLDSWVDAANRKIGGLAAERRLLALAAAAATNPIAQARYSRLRTIAEHRTQGAIDNQQKLAKATASAKALLSRRLGESAATFKANTELSTLTTFTATSTPPPALSGLTNTNSNLNCYATPAGPAKTTLECNTEGTTKQTINKIEQQLEKATSIKIGGSSIGKLQLPTFKLTAKGAINTGENPQTLTDTSGCETNIGVENDNYAGAANAIRLEKAQSPYKFTIDDVKFSNDPPGPEDQTANTIQLLTTDNQVAAAVDNARKQKQTLPKQLKEERLETVAALREPTLMAAWMKTGAGKKLTLETDPSKVAEIIFGKKEGSIQSEFLHPLTKDSHTIPTDGEPITGSTEQLSKTNFAAAMAYYTVQKLKNAAEASVGAKPEGEKKKKQEMQQKKRKTGIIQP